VCSLASNLFHQVVQFYNARKCNLCNLWFGECSLPTVSVKENILKFPFYTFTVNQLIEGCL